MLLGQAKIITAAIALTIGGSLLIAKSPASANLSPLESSQNPSLAQATGQPPNRKFRPSRFDGGRLMEQLNLNQGQKQQISAIRQKYQGQMQQLWEEMRSKRQKLEEMMAGTATEADIRRQHQQIAQLDQKMDNLRFESMLETRKVLTPEQRRQFAQLMQQQREQFRERFRGSQRGE